jgi:hypothetical protein
MANRAKDHGFIVSQQGADRSDAYSARTSPVLRRIAMGSDSKRLTTISSPSSETPATKSGAAKVQRNTLSAYVGFSAPTPLCQQTMHSPDCKILNSSNCDSSSTENASRPANKTATSRPHPMANPSPSEQISECHWLWWRLDCLVSHHRFGGTKYMIVDRGDYCKCSSAYVDARMAISVS